jgi:hypothetical protein
MCTGICFIITAYCTSAVPVLTDATDDAVVAAVAAVAAVGSG